MTFVVDDRIPGSPEILILLSASLTGPIPPSLFARPLEVGRDLAAGFFKLFREPLYHVGSYQEIEGGEMPLSQAPSPRSAEHETLASSSRSAPSILFPFSLGTDGVAVKIPPFCFGICEWRFASSLVTL